MARDARGLAVTAASAEAAALLDATVEAYCGFRRHTGDRLKQAIAADGDMVLAHVLRGCFMMLFATRAFVARAAQAVAAAEAALARVGATPREALHLAALRDWTKGDLAAATARWQAVLREHPRDLLALKLAHYGCFYRGDSAGMLAATADALGAWDAAVPGHGFVLGCHAFALEECGDYAAADSAGREAIERNPADIWAAHAVAHVFEMRDRPGEGVAWIDALAAGWRDVNNFAFHLWWHRALFLLALGRGDEALSLYDRAVRPEPTDDYLDIANAASLLWRFEQAGIAVGGRWEELAARAAAHIEDHVLVFADLHYLMALAAARSEAVESWQRSSRAFAAAGEEDAAAILAAAGLALGEAVVAHRRGAWRQVVALLLPLEASVRRIGGSHAQRDLFHQMLIDAALREGDHDLARSLLAKRLAERPNNAWARAELRRCAGPPD